MKKTLLLVIAVIALVALFAHLPYVQLGPLHVDGVSKILT